MNRSKKILIGVVAGAFLTGGTVSGAQEDKKKQDSLVVFGAKSFGAGVSLITTLAAFELVRKRATLFSESEPEEKVEYGMKLGLCIDGALFSTYATYVLAKLAYKSYQSRISDAGSDSIKNEELK